MNTYNQYELLKQLIDSNERINAMLEEIRHNSRKHADEMKTLLRVILFSSVIIILSIVFVLSFIIK
jgi:hypothetical protein